jgi:hypothetical protein
VRCDKDSVGSLKRHSSPIISGQSDTDFGGSPEQGPTTLGRLQFRLAGRMHYSAYEYFSHEMYSLQCSKIYILVQETLQL